MWDAGCAQPTNQVTHRPGLVQFMIARWRSCTSCATRGYYHDTVLNISYASAEERRGLLEAKPDGPDWCLCPLKFAMRCQVSQPTYPGGVFSLHPVAK